jgi:delta 1-pyrroline-5-carboxylate dehydrogenase
MGPSGVQWPSAPALADAPLDDIDALGYGFTRGVHTRIDAGSDDR